MIDFARNISILILACLVLNESRAAEISNVRILTFNVWSGEGTKAGQEKITEIIRASAADIVGLQEMESAPGMQVAESLGFHYLQQSGSDTQVISRYPILERTSRRWGAEIEITPGHSLWLFNAHLNAYPYQPYDLRDGTLASNEAEVIAAANAARGNQVTSLVRDIDESGALASGVPVFVTGDFNEPSHLDWTQAVAEATERPYDLKVNYPASTRITELGFVDSFRSVRPLETASGDFDFAYTWTPGYPPPNVPRNEVHDRIDFIYHKDGSSVTAVPKEAKTVGPSADRDADSTMTNVEVSGYNSDHRAVVASYDMRGLRGSALTFSKLGTNGDVIDAKYGDKLLTTPDVLVEYSANNGQWKFWEEGNWDRGGVAFLDSGDGEPATGDSRFELTLSAENLAQIQLEKFDILDWMDTDTIGHTVQWQILNEDQVVTNGVAEVPHNGTFTVQTNMTKARSGPLTLRLTHINGFDNKLAIDNVVFKQFLLGDLNRNGLLDSFDIDETSSHIRMAGVDETYDLNSDGVVDDQDRTYWVETLANTHFGDSNLDGEFNTKDLVKVFQSGQYEDELEGNSSWSDGDWNGDGEFDSRDLVKAFRAGGFEQGPRIAATVPESNRSNLVVVGGLCFLSFLRSKHAQNNPTFDPAMQRVVDASSEITQFHK